MGGTTIKILRIIILSALVIVSLNPLAFAKEDEKKTKLDNQAKLDKAKKYVIGTKLGMVAMSYSNLTDSDADEIGYKSYELYRKTGKTDAVIRVWLMNTSNKSISVNPLNFKVTTKKGYTVPLSNYTFRTRNPFPSTNLEPHTKIDGFVVFELGMGDDFLKIIYDDRAGCRVEREEIDARVMGLFERDLKKYDLSK
jgi:hypothetical protein